MAEINSEVHINDAGSRPVNSYSNFKKSLPYRFAGTYRFGEYGVNFVTDVVPSEKHRFKCAHTLRSYTMENPLLQSFKMKKEYFMVPDSAILPLNYEKFITVPNIGEDINPLLVGTTVENFISKLNTFAVSARSFAVGQDSETALFRYVVWYDMMFSSGGLLPFLGAHIGEPAEVDAAVDAFWSAVASLVSSYYFRITIDGITYVIDRDPSNVGEVRISLREAISRMRDDFSFTSSSNIDASSQEWSNLKGLAPTSSLDSSDDAPFDLRRCFAYQISCAHFFTNDHVDYIYSAELYRQSLRSLIRSIISTDVDTTFSWNGVNYQYDTCSAFMFDSVLQNEQMASPTDYAPFFNYFRYIFGYNRSLRFGDYFTGSRTRPLAVGDTKVQVNAGYVDVVESIRASWTAKLLAQIERLGHRLSEQTKGLFPRTNTVQDWHDPIWLGQTESDVFADEIDNTGDAQYSREISTTSVLNSSDEGFAFNVEVPDRYGTIIGICYFDLSRFYTHSIERSFFHTDRYDKFQPFLQFNGDQAIYKKELDGRVPTIVNSAFGYTGRYMEYKQRYNQAAGGFINGSLPGMIFLADVGRTEYDVDELSPDYIRSYPTEFDEFFPRLTGYSLGTYFHFMVITSNYDDSDKPMAYNPQLN